MTDRSPNPTNPPKGISPDFTWSEFSVTSTGLANDLPNWARVPIGRLVAAVLQPWRDLVGPLQVTSGYRSSAVNIAINGSSTSQHTRGEAADVVPMAMDRSEAWSILLAMVAEGLPVDQAIIYDDRGHVHASHTSSRPNRRQVLVYVSEVGLYVPWATYIGPLKEHP